jgi:hypothetical protein
MPQARATAVRVFRIPALRFAGHGARKRIARHRPSALSV